MRASDERFGLDPRSAALCGCVALLFIAHATYLACVTEDAFITFRYAQNLVAGHGLVWNVGEAPVEGYTNFMWLLISAGVLALGLDLPATSQWIGGAASVAILALVYLCGRLLGWTARFSIIPCLALACSGPFATWAVSGMETNWFALWIVASAYCYAQFLARNRAVDVWCCVASLFLATLTRPEGLMIAGLVGGGLLYSALRGSNEEGSSSPRTTVMALSVYAALVFVYVVWRWHYFGYPLPNTFYAKTGGGVAQALRGAGYAWLFALHYVVPWGLAIGLAFVRRPATPSSITGLLPLSGAIVTLYTAYIVAVGGDYMAMYRFFVPILPFLYLLIAAALERAISAAEGSSAMATATKAATLLGLAGTLFHSTPQESAWVAKPELMHGNHRGVELERWYVARHKLIGEFFARYGEPGDSIATGAIGAVAYYSGLRVYDVHGITDAHIAHIGTAELVRGELGSGLPGHEKSDYPYVFAKMPTFYMFSRKLRKEPMRGVPLLVPEVDDLVAREYRVGSVPLVDKANGQSGYLSFLERRDRNTIPPVPR